MAKRKVAEEAASPTNKRKKVEAGDFEPVNPDVLPANAKLDLADCEIYYVPDFVDKKTAKRWYKELLELGTCMSSCERVWLQSDIWPPQGTR